MIPLDFTFTAPLWIWSSEKASWHFVTVPEDISGMLKSFAQDAKRGFGSVRVGVRIGETQWKTSVFPDKDTGCFFLPIKKCVRASEGLSVGHDTTVHLEVFV